MPSIDSVTSEGGDAYKHFLRDKNVKPHKIQEAFLCLPDNVFEALYGGAAYGGKSWILTLLPIFRGFYKYRGFKGIILRRKFPDLEREIIRLSKEYYPQTGATYNEQKHSWEWKAYGSYMDFGHVQNDSDITQYDGYQANYCAFDETTHFSGYPYHYMVGSRIRPGGDFHLAFVRNGTNPGGIGQNWVNDRFVKPNPDGYKLLRDKSTGLLRTFIPANLEDNPYGMEFDPDYAKKLEIIRTVSEAEYRAKRYGDWNAFKGSVFTTFRPIRFPEEPDNALHVIDSFEIPTWWPRILTIDWGKTAMCHAMWGAISPSRRLYLYRERTWQGKDIAVWASEIKEIQDTEHENLVHVGLCGSAWQDRGQGTIASDFAKYSGLVPQSTENTRGSRVETLQTCHDMLRWEKVVNLKSHESFYDMEKAQWIYRNYGPEALAKYQALFADEPEEDNLPVIQIFERACPVLVETLPMAQYDETRTEDIQEFDGDDPIDNFRYMCKYANKYMTGDIGNMEHQIKIQGIIAQATAAQDMTMLYRSMEVAEGRGGIQQMIGIRPGSGLNRRGRRR